MAIHPERRENLLEEATAFTRRWLFRFSAASKDKFPNWSGMEPNAVESNGTAENDRASWELFLGCRAPGGVAVHFDIDPVLQFNAEGQLRRLYWAGQRYAAESGRLLRLQRESLGGPIRFTEHPLDPATEQQLCAACLERLAAAADMIRQRQYDSVGCIPSPPDAEALADSLASAAATLQRLSGSFTIAAHRQV